MQTKLIAMDLSLQVLSDRQLRSDELRSQIETQLTHQGTPLRWAITAIDPVSQTARIEAVVTIDS
jgi:hypothetical protein